MGLPGNWDMVKVESIVITPVRSSGFWLINMRTLNRSFSLSTMFSVLGVTTAHIQAVLSFTLVYGIYKVSTFIYDKMTSPVRDIPGPPSPSFVYGSSKESNDSVLQESWINQYGTTIQFKAMLGDSRLMTTDLKAINYIFFNSCDYPKPEAISYSLRQLIGNGLLSVEGDVHKRQRKILNPAFGPKQLREMTELFVETALELRDIWSTEIAQHGGVGPIECLSWMGRTTLDIIGLAGFNYKFNALSGEPEKNELMQSFSTIIRTGAKPSIISILKAIFPSLRFIPTPMDPERKNAIAVMDRIGAQILEQSKTFQDDDKRSKPSSRKDILSLLIQANTNQDLPEAQRLKDEEVTAQIPTFLLAGHETTSTAMAWALYALTQNKQVQTKLRQELSSASTDNPTMDDLNGLPYLDAVVRETLRLYPPVPSAIRAAKKDDCIPLSKPFTDRKGIVHNEIRVRKGQSILVPIVLVNRDKSIWGEDSTQFKPERWANIPDTATSVPGVWANITSFIGGPRACIGYRFSLLEMKTLLFTLVRAFEFDLAVPAEDIGTKPAAVQRPLLLTDPDNSNQMPLLVRPVSSNL